MTSCQRHTVWRGSGIIYISKISSFKFNSIKKLSNLKSRARGTKGKLRTLNTNIFQWGLFTKTLKRFVKSLCLVSFRDPIAASLVRLM